jgi:hypothetical protein
LRRNAAEKGRNVNPGGVVANVKPAFRRGAFFASLFLLGFANDARILQGIAEGTIGGAILGTFGISKIGQSQAKLTLSILR